MTSFDEAILERFRSCRTAEFPVCLDRAMNKMFGPAGKRPLNNIIMNETFENTPIDSPKDIWNLYERYLERTANILGDDVAQVIGFESLKEMEEMSCQKCPLYDMELKRRSGKD